VFAFLLFSVRIHAETRTIQWQSVRPGLAFDRIYDPVYCRKGSRFTAALLIDPSEYRFEAFHFSEMEDRQLRTAGEWKDLLGAPVVFNAGQYYERFTHMGLLVREGRNLGSPFIKKWKGLLVEEYDGDFADRTRVLDCAYQPHDPSGAAYRFAVQSYMVLDKQGNKRIRKSDLLANRTSVISLKDGRLVLLCTEGAYTLYDFADFMRELDLDIHHAMGLDGGHQAQLAVQAESFQYETYGLWSTGARASLGNMAFPVRLPIPAVIALFPRSP